MKIQNLAKISTAIACTLTLCANAADSQDASLISKNYSTDNINQLLGLSGHSQMKAVNSVELDNGITKVRFQQYYQGVPVFGYSVAATKTAMGLLTDVKGQLLNLNPDLNPDFNGKRFSTKVRISAEQAMQMMIDTDKVLGKDASASAKHAIYNKQNEMFIYMLNGEPKLVHRISYVVPGQNGGEPSRPVYFVDAHSGDIVLAYNNLQHQKIGSGPGGLIKEGCYEYGVDFDYLDVDGGGEMTLMSNANVRTVNLSGATSGNTTYSFASLRNIYKETNGACSPLNDAHFFGGVVFDMYNSYVGQAPLTFQLTMRVHYGTNYANAFWDGSSMTFGDGNSTLYPLAVGLDITTHEVSHGFTEQNSGLVYSGMSGGMNEAYSDMAGEAAEYFLYGTNDFLVGAKVFKNAGILRDMANPTQDGSSIDHANDYTSGLNVHHSSGVYNKAFYLLASTAGWDVQKAFEVMALANQSYWTANSTFDEGACGVESAAEDRSYNKNDVTAAFAAVGVMCEVITIPPPEILSKGEVRVLSTSQAGTEYVYSYVTPADVDSVSFNISGGTGDADLYVSYDTTATTANYDCRPYLAGNNETCDFAVGQAGLYYIMVKAYSPFSDVSLVPDHTTKGIPPNSDSGTVANIDVATGEMTFWTVEVPVGATRFDVSTVGGTGDADLYVKFGSAPTTSSYDCRPYIAGNNESCPVTTPAAGTYHIGIRGYAAATGVTLNWHYQ